MSRSAALETVINAITGDVSPLELGAALATLGVPATQQDRVHLARSEHARLRRREHELGALFSSARELAEVRDTEQLLDKLVRRAHEILGCDVTYLSEFDQETRELHVRTTIGTYTPEFRRLRVPAGRGLASEIAETRTASWVSRYSEYLADRHEAGIDRAVELEGIISILGVPMLSGDDVLGVLFVATREERTFAPEQVALLSALADHASVVLQTARMLRETRQALDRLTEHLTERDRANVVHQELVQVVLTGGRFDQLVRTLSSALGRQVTIVDAEDRVVASSARGDRAAISPEVRAAIATSSVSGHCQVLENGAVAAMRAGTQDFGALLFGKGDFELGPVDRRTIERAAQVCSLLELQQQAVANAEGRILSDLVVDILDARPGRRDDLERRARRFGVVLADLDTVQLYVVAGDQRANALASARRLVGDGGLVGRGHGVVVVLLDSRRAGVSAQDLREHIGRRVGGPVLAVLPPRGDLAESFTLALRTSRLLDVLGVTDAVVDTDEYLPYASVFDTDKRSLTSFVEGQLRPVLAYDEERGTELVATLRAFVRCNASPTKAARLLNFHTNTILQRLERLDVLLGPGWREDDRFFRISLAVRLHGLMRT
jgi:GAF domain-containing protein